MLLMTGTELIEKILSDIISHCCFAHITYPYCFSPKWQYNNYEIIILAESIFDNKIIFMIVLHIHFEIF
jgi:hypothetical protein